MTSKLKLIIATVKPFNLAARNISVFDMSSWIQTRFNEQQVVDNNNNFNNINIKSADQYQSFYMAWAEVSTKPMMPRTYRLSSANGVNLKYGFKQIIILNTSQFYQLLTFQRSFNLALRPDTW